MQGQDGGRRQQALAKLETLSMQLGYPDHWKDYANATGATVDAIGRTQTWWTDADHQAFQRPATRAFQFA